MPQIEEQLKRLQDKLQQLLQHYQLLQKENNKLKLEIQRSEERRVGKEC